VMSRGVSESPCLRAPFSVIDRLRPHFHFFFHCSGDPRALHSFPTRRSSDLFTAAWQAVVAAILLIAASTPAPRSSPSRSSASARSEEHTSELQSLRHLVCRLLLEKKKKQKP